jgi:hypothetical protein
VCAGVVVHLSPARREHARVLRNAFRQCPEGRITFKKPRQRGLRRVEAFLFLRREDGVGAVRAQGMEHEQVPVGQHHVHVLSHGAFERAEGTRPGHPGGVRRNPRAKRFQRIRVQRLAGQQHPVQIVGGVPLVRGQRGGGEAVGHRKTDSGISPHGG